MYIKENSRKDCCITLLFSKIGLWLSGSSRDVRIEIKCKAKLERFSIECRKTKTKPITYQLDYSANLKPQTKVTV